LPTDTEHSPLDPSNSGFSAHGASDHDASGHAASGPVETLPRAELNPLLNPLLGANMGLWAEVYFRNPPENREQAVLDLLQELKNKNQNPAAAYRAAAGSSVAGCSPASNPAPIYRAEDRVQDYTVVQPASPAQISLTRSSYSEPISTLYPKDPSRDFSEPQPLRETLPSSVCPQCGYERANQRFCGMCGTPLHRELENEHSDEVPRTPGFSASELSHVQQLAESLVTQNVRQDQDQNTLRRQSEVELERFEPEILASKVFEPSRAQEFSTIRDRRGQDSDISGLLRSLGGESEAQPQHRGFMVAGVVVVVLTLGYFGWKSAQTPGTFLNAKLDAITTSHSEPTPGSQATDQTAVATPQSDAATQTPVQNGRDRGSSTSPTNASSSNAASSGRNAKSAASASESAKTTGLASIPKDASVRSSGNEPQPELSGTASGNEELAMAQKYLDGSAGTKNDSEAAQWLWKAVSKRNLPATMLLADMYLRGTGVSKNCDQARILLDAAAARGAKDAAFRLRNIQSFGCQ
jgi:hypothetical protein